MELARKKRGLTKECLENAAGLAKGYASRITRGLEGGRRPGARTTDSLAAALDVDSSWLLSGVGRGPEDEAPASRRVARVNLDTAAALLRREGQVSPETVARVREATAGLGELDLATWIQLLADVQRRR